MLQIAAWSVLNASTGMVVAAGPLTRITQTIDRAEVTSLLAALQWGAHTELDLCLWSDSMSTVQMAEHIQQHDHIPHDAENYDLWHQVQAAFHDRWGTTTLLRWIPSHIPPSMAEDAFEDWIIHWNGLTDQHAVFTNHARPINMLRHLQRLRGQIEHWSLRLRQLRQFYFLVADSAPSAPTDTREVEQTVSSEDEEWLLLSWEDNLPVNWAIRCQHGHFPVPGAFITAIITWLCAAEQLPGKVRVLSDVEFVFILALDADFQFPCQADGSTALLMRSVSSCFQRPMVGCLLKYVQLALGCISELFPHMAVRTPPAPVKELGLYKEFAGLKAHCPDQLWRGMRAKVGSFTATRAVRRSGDLSRPMP